MRDTTTYNGIIQNIDTDKISIINNPEITKSCIINIPKELNNMEIFIYIYLNKDIPKIKYQIFFKDIDIFKYHSEDYLSLNF